MKNIQRIGFTISLALLTSCASSPPQSRQSVYRPPATDQSTDIARLQAKRASEIQALPAATTPQAVAFQVVSALATRSPQLGEEQQITMKNPHYEPGSTVVHYDMDIQASYNPIDLATSESFLIVSIRLLKLSSKLDLSSKDLPLVDGKGSAHLPLCYPSFRRQDAWSAMTASASLGLKPKDTIDLKWLFKVPTDALTGSIIQFQGKTYPLTMSSNQEQ